MATRATCESCQEAQPVDWKAGDLCVHCSGPVRREERCFWCNTWQPAGGFCRQCGAEQVGHEHYGAARMLTASGADMFSIPKLIREMDPGRLAVFADKYARQRGVVSRHVDDMIFVEGHCRHEGFAAALEDELVTSLPWSDELAAEYQHVSAPPGGVERLHTIIDRTPFETTRCLAVTALLWTGEWNVLRQVAGLARAHDRVGHEATLAVTWWRTVTACRLNRFQLPLDVLEHVELKDQVAVRLAWFGRPADPEHLAAARRSQDADLAFAAALATGEIATLRQALEGDALRQRAAAAVLAERGELASLQGWLRGADSEAQHDIIDALARDEASRAGPLAPLLLEIMESTDDERVIVDAGRLLARATDRATAVRVAAACKGEMYVVQALMKEDTGLSPEDLAKVGAELVKHGYLSHHKYGVTEAAKRGAFPDDFVPRVFDQAEESPKIELCRFAECQLEGRPIEVVHAFLLRTVFGPYSGKVRAGAWWALSR
ncbi:MAG TPA: hypothetical protein VLC93_11075, partial [Myxococcota bacterium]|nr:hypothetical protein [Myxococcota bacterium]